MFPHRWGVYKGFDAAAFCRNGQYWGIMNHRIHFYPQTIPYQATCRVFFLLVFLLAALPGRIHAHVDGYFWGAPRVVLGNPGLSPLVGGKTVRTIFVDGRAWRISSPEGFMDLEALTPGLLPGYLYIPAWNLRDYSVSFIPRNAAPGSAPLPGALPSYSLATIELATKKMQKQGFAGAALPLREFLAEGPEQAALAAYLKGKGPAPTREAWQGLRHEGTKNSSASFIHMS